MNKVCQRVDWYFSKVFRESPTEKAAPEQRLKERERSSAGVWGKSTTSRGKSQGKAQGTERKAAEGEQLGEKVREKMGGGVRNRCS